MTMTRGRDNKIRWQIAKTVPSPNHFDDIAAIIPRKRFISKFQHRNEKNAGILRITSTNGASTSIQDDPHDEQNHTWAQDQQMDESHHNRHHHRHNHRPDNRQHRRIIKPHTHKNQARRAVRPKSAMKLQRRSVPKLQPGTVIVDFSAWKKPDDKTTGTVNANAEGKTSETGDVTTKVAEQPRSKSSKGHMHQRQTRRNNSDNARTLSREQRPSKIVTVRQTYGGNNFVYDPAYRRGGERPKSAVQRNVSTAAYDRRGGERPKSAVQRNVTSTAVYGHGYQSNVDEKTSQYDREAHGEEWPTDTRHHRNSAPPRHRRRSPRNNNRKKSHHDREIADMRIDAIGRQKRISIRPKVNRRSIEKGSRRSRDDMFLSSKPNFALASFVMAVKGRRKIMQRRRRMRRGRIRRFDSFGNEYYDNM